MIGICMDHLTDHGIRYTGITKKSKKVVGEFIYQKPGGTILKINRIYRSE